MNALLTEWIRRLETLEEEQPEVRGHGFLHEIKAETGQSCYCAQGVAGQVLVDAGLARWYGGKTGFQYLVVEGGDYLSGCYALPNKVWELLGLSVDVVDFWRNHPANFVLQMNDSVKGEEVYSHSWKKIATRIRDYAATHPAGEDHEAQ